MYKPNLQMCSDGPILHTCTSAQIGTGHHLATIIHGGVQGAVQLPFSSGGGWGSSTALLLQNMTTNAPSTEKSRATKHDWGLNPRRVRSPAPPATSKLLASLTQSSSVHRRCSTVEQQMDSSCLHALQRCRSTSTPDDHISTPPANPVALEPLISCCCCCWGCPGRIGYCYTSNALDNIKPTPRHPQNPSTHARLPALQIQEVMYVQYTKPQRHTQLQHPSHLRQQPPQ